MPLPRLALSSARAPPPRRRTIRGQEEKEEAGELLRCGGKEGKRTPPSAPLLGCRERASEQPSAAEHSARLPLLTLAAPAASSSLASEAAGRGAHWAAACQEREGERGGWRRAEGRGGCSALPTAGSRRAPAGQLRPPPQSSRGCQPCPRPAPALSVPVPPRGGGGGGC